MSTIPAPPVRQKTRFAVNVLWSWTGIILAVVSAALLTPVMTRKLGDDGYGVWALAFSLIEYYWLLDLGFRSATAKYTAHFHTVGDTAKLNEVVSTGFLYFLGVAVLLLIATWTLAPIAPRFFDMDEEYKREFRWLLSMIGTSWVVVALTMVFQASMEGLQRFDVVNRIQLVVALIRVSAFFAVLYSGGGLLALGAVAVACQSGAQIAVFLSCHFLYPEIRVNPRRVSRPMLKQMAGYGVHTMTATAATQLLNQSAPLMLAHFHPVATAGYLNAPNRIVQLTGVEVASRMGVVSTSKAAELAARGDTDNIRRLATITNRYCLTIFLLPSVFLLTYGTPLLKLWLGESWAVASGPILPILILGTGLAVAAQFNSSAILYGLAKHGRFARGLLVEGMVSVVLLWLVVPRYGLFGAACVTSTMMILNRGLFLPWALCQELGTSWLRFLADILWRPLVGLAPALAVGFALRQVLPGDSWMELIAAAAAVVSCYGAIAFFVSVEPEHRGWAITWLRRRLGRS